MNTVVIYQSDPHVAGVLKCLTDLGAGIQTVPNGDQVQVQELNPLVGPKGRIDSLGQFGFLAIAGFANNLLGSLPLDLVTFQVVFIFHQITGDGVKGVMDTIRMVRDTRILPSLTQKHRKRLDVAIVNLLSCESATDKSAVSPVEPVLQPLVDQAQRMRALACKAFIIPKSPPPEPGDYHPRVVTYTTGDPETGGIVLNPFVVSFRRLPGHFNDQGVWVYDNPNGTDHAGVPTGGTIHTSFEGKETSQDIGAGHCINIMGFPRP